MKQRHIEALGLFSPRDYLVATRSAFSPWLGGTKNYWIATVVGDCVSSLRGNEGFRFGGWLGPQRLCAGMMTTSQPRYLTTYRMIATFRITSLVRGAAGGVLRAERGVAS
jgi:hypothetical protein